MKRILLEAEDSTADLEKELTTLENELEQAELGLTHAHPREEGRYRNIIARLHDMINVINNIIVTKVQTGKFAAGKDDYEFIIDSRKINGMNINELRSVVRFMINEAKKSKNEKKQGKKLKKAKPSKHAKLEEQEQMWSGRRSTWYMPRLSDY